MIYIKYTDRKNPSQWSIWAHEKGSKEGKLILNSNGYTGLYTTTLHCKLLKLMYNTKYLTQKEVDLIKLKLL